MSSSKVDFESLDKLLTNDGKAAAPAFNHAFEDLQNHQVDPFQPSNGQKILLYSSSFEKSIHATSFTSLAGPLYDVLAPTTANDGAWWLDVQNPSESNLRLLCDTFHIHPLTFEDIWARERGEKYEVLRSYYFVSLRSFNAVKEDLKTSIQPYYLYVIVLPQGTLSFTFNQSVHPVRVRDRLEGLKDLMSVRSDFICYALIDDIVDTVMAATSSIEAKVSELDDGVYSALVAESGLISRIIETRNNVLQLITLLPHKFDVLSAFRKHLKDGNGDIARDDDLKLYINDVEDHLVTVQSSLLHWESVLSRSQETYLAQSQVQSNSGRQRVYTLLIRCTVFSLVVTAVNVVCGLFSMNVATNSPFFNSTSLIPFAIIMSAEALFCLVVVFICWYFKIV